MLTNSCAIRTGVQSRPYLRPWGMITNQRPHGNTVIDDPHVVSAASIRVGLDVAGDEFGVLIRRRGLGRDFCCHSSQALLGDLGLSLQVYHERYRLAPRYAAAAVA